MSYAPTKYGQQQQQQYGQQTNYPIYESTTTTNSYSKSSNPYSSSTFYSTQPSRPWISATLSQVFYRAVLGTPLCMAGGVLGSYGVGLVSSVKIAPIVGATAGAYFVLAGIITTIFCNRFDLVGPNNLLPKLMKLAVDIALAALVTYAKFANHGVLLSSLQVSLAAGSSFLGFAAIAVCALGTLLAAMELAEKGFGA